MKTRRSPAAARFAREKLEKELVIRFLIDKLIVLRKQVRKIYIMKGNSQRHVATYHLLSEMNTLLEQLKKENPRRTLAFYTHRDSIKKY